MATKAFVLIETVMGKDKEVIAAMNKLEGAKSAEVVTGPYDMIAVIEAQDLNDVGELVTAKISQIAGITRTVTCIVIKAV